MPNLHRLATLGAGVSTLSLVLASTSSSPSSANQPQAFGVAPGPHGSAPATTRADTYGASRRSNGRHRDTAPTPPPCTGSSNNGYAFQTNDVAYGSGSVAAGNSTHACGNDSSVLGGAYDETGASDAFVAGGVNNLAAAASSFVGAGFNNQAMGDDSFVGAGGGVYAGSNGNTVLSNMASGEDSFIGAGDANTITSKATGSFIGAGGSELAAVDEAGNSISAQDSFIGAGDGNAISGDLAFIGGGIGGTVTNDYSALGAGYNDRVTGSAAFGGAGEFNQVVGQWAFVGSGSSNDAAGAGSFVGAGGTIGNLGNVVSGQDSFVGAGSSNTVNANESFVGAGQSNTIASGSTDSVIAGGNGNVVSAQKGVVGGGEANEAEGSFTTVPGGYHNLAIGNESFAAGAQAEAHYAGSFVWSDYASGEKPLNDSHAGEFVARASGGVYFFSNTAASAGVHLAAGSGAWASLSDRNAKTDIVPLDDASILAKVAALPVSTWSYKTEHGVRHVGPMAQDFYAAFRVGDDDRHITSIDEDGVALAAIKALHDENADLKARLAAQNSRLATVEAEIGKLVGSRTRATVR